MNVTKAEIEDHLAILMMGRKPKKHKCIIALYNTVLFWEDALKKAKE